MSHMYCRCLARAGLQGGTEGQRPAARSARFRLQARCTHKCAIRSGTKIREVGRGLSLESTVLGGSANEKEEEKYQKLVKNNCSLPRTVSR